MVPGFRQAKVKRIFRKEVKGMGILPVKACVFQKVAFAVFPEEVFA